MRLCYCDESGTGDEPIAVMVGIVVDASRMHLTKMQWQELLGDLSAVAGRKVEELHTRKFYKGDGIWKYMDGEMRARYISAIFQWLENRKHHVVYSAVLKDSYKRASEAGEIPDELNTIWRFMGFHLILAMQGYCQR